MQPKMRVLHIAPSLDPKFGGPGHSSAALCHALKEVGVDVTLYAFGREASVPVDGSLMVERFRPLAGTAAYPTVTYYRQLLRNLARFDLVHLHCVWNPPITVAAFACRKVGVPYIVSPRGMLQDGAVQERRWLKEAYHRACERRTIGGASALHFLTRVERDNSRRFLDGVVPFFVVPNGVDPALAEAVEPGRFRQAHAGLQGKRILLFLGRLHRSKGLELQAQSVALLTRDFPDLVWVLVGPDDGEWGHVLRLSRELKLERHVLWTGLLPQKASVEALADADAFVLTSRRGQEGHSMAMNEALAVGVPVIITETVGFDEVKTWGAGHVVPWNPHHVAAAIAEVLMHRARAEQMREAARRLVAERLAWPKIAEQMVRLYEQVLAGR